MATETQEFSLFLSGTSENNNIQDLGQTKSWCSSVSFLWQWLTDDIYEMVREENNDSYFWHMFSYSATKKKKVRYGMGSKRVVTWIVKLKKKFFLMNVVHDSPICNIPSYGRAKTLSIRKLYIFPRLSNALSCDVFCLLLSYVLTIWLVHGEPALQGQILCSLSMRILISFFQYQFLLILQFAWHLC